jgi:hypothetical protein
MQSVKNSRFALGILVAGFSALMAPAIAAPIIETGGATVKSIAVLERVAQTTTPSAFVNLPGATATFNIPTGQSRLIKAGFSAESSCYDAAIQYGLRFMVDGPGVPVEMNPLRVAMTSLSTAQITERKALVQWRLTPLTARYGFLPVLTLSLCSGIRSTASVRLGWTTGASMWT